MGQMIGADVEELERLALQFDQSAARLRQIAASVRQGIQVSAWVGPAAVHFRVLWDSQHSARVRAAADEISTAATALRRNAAEQRAASNSLDAGAGAAAHASYVAVGAASGAGGVSAQLSLSGAAQSLLNELGSGGESVWKHFESGWGAVSAGIPEIAGLSAADGLATLVQLGKLTGHGVPLVGTVLSIGSDADLLGRAIHGQVSWGEVLSKGADTLGSSLLEAGPNPVTKLIGLNVIEWNKVAQEAQNVDWSAGALKQTWDYAWSHPGDTAGEFGKATVKVGVDFFNTLVFNKEKK